LFAGKYFWTFSGTYDDNLATYYTDPITGESVANVGKAEHYTLLFNMYVMMQIFNEINARKIYPDELNPFKGFFSNGFFLFVIIFSVVVQILLVEIGYSVVKVVPLSW
jgi:Ca2+ transporting ATPase